MAEERAEHFYRNIQFFPSDQATVRPNPNDESFKQFKSPVIRRGNVALYLKGLWSANMQKGGVSTESPACAITSDGLITGTIGSLASQDFYRLEMVEKDGVFDNPQRVVSVGLTIDGWGKTFSFIYHPDKNRVPGPVVVGSWKRVAAPSLEPVTLMVTPEDPAILGRLRGSLRFFSPPIPEVHLIS